MCPEMKCGRVSIVFTPHLLVLVLTHGLSAPVAPSWGWGAVREGPGSMTEGTVLPHPCLVSHGLSMLHVTQIPALGAAKMQLRCSALQLQELCSAVGGAFVQLEGAWEDFR